MTQRRALLIGILATITVFAADQASKFWVLERLQLPARGQIDVLPVLSLTMVWNRGITFGLLNHLGNTERPILVVVALAIIIALGAWMRRAERARISLALGAIAGGALGNVLDRLRFGAVVDFIHAHAFGWSWYVFNVADAAIVCGVALLALDGFLAPKRQPAE